MDYRSIVLGNVIIENVVLVEEMKHTLLNLSISQLSDRGYHTTFDHKKCIVTAVKDREFL